MIAADHAARPLRLLTGLALALCLGACADPAIDQDASARPLDGDVANNCPNHEACMALGDRRIICARRDGADRCITSCDSNVDCSMHPHGNQCVGGECACDTDFQCRTEARPYCATNDLCAECTENFHCGTEALCEGNRCVPL